jgi:hypothetical protein
MTSPVSNTTPYSYLNVLDPTAPPVNFAGSPATTYTGPSTGTTPTPSNTGTTPTQLSPDVLSLLQEFSPSNAFGQVPSLLGGNGSSLFSPLAGSIEGNLLAQNYTASIIAAYQNTQHTAASHASDPVSALISSYTSGLNSGNSDLLHEAQAILAANSLPFTA